MPLLRATEEKSFLRNYRSVDVGDVITAFEDAHHGANSPQDANAIDGLLAQARALEAYLKENSYRLRFMCR